MQDLAVDEQGQVEDYADCEEDEDYDEEDE